MPARGLGRKRRVFVVVLTVLFGLAAVAIGVAGYRAFNPWVTPENFRKLTHGMTLAEAEAILGKGSETSQFTGYFHTAPAGSTTYVWKNGKKRITVSFLNGRIVARGYVNLP